MSKPPLPTPAPRPPKSLLDAKGRKVLAFRFDDNYQGPPIKRGSLSGPAPKAPYLSLSTGPAYLTSKVDWVIVDATTSKVRVVHKDEANSYTPADPPPDR